MNASNATTHRVDLTTDDLHRLTAGDGGHMRMSGLGIARDVQVVLGTIFTKADLVDIAWTVAYLAGNAADGGSSPREVLCIAITTLLRRKHIRVSAPCQEILRSWELLR